MKTRECGYRVPHSLVVYKSVLYRAGYLLLRCSYLFRLLLAQTVQKFHNRLYGIAEIALLHGYPIFFSCLIQVVNAGKKNFICDFLFLQHIGEALLPKALRVQQHWSPRLAAAESGIRSAGLRSASSFADGVRSGTGRLRYLRWRTDPSVLR